MRHILSTISLLIALAVASSPQTGHAVISLRDGSTTAITYATGYNINQSFTVTAGADVMVVTLGTYKGVASSTPATLTWNGQTLTRAVTMNNGSSTYRELAIYYLTNPPPGTANITGAANSGVTANWVQAYTLSGVNVGAAPVVGSINNSSALSLSVTVAGAPAGAWAAAAGISGSGTAASLTATSGTVDYGSDVSHSSSAVTAMGSVSNLTAGANTFTYTQTGGTAGKVAVVAAIFSPPAPPTIIAQPQPQLLYAGRTARFSVSANGASPTYRWYNGSTPLADGPTGTGSSISGATSTSLTISNIGTADVASYSLQVTDANGTTPSSAAALSIVTPTEPYEIAVVAAQPIAYYRFNETGDPATNNTLAYDYAGGYYGTYGITVQNGNANYNIAGPRPGDGFSGFGAANAAAQFPPGYGTSRVTVPAWNLNTNTVTITAWMKPAGVQANSGGIVFCRGGGTIAGLRYGNYIDSFNVLLGYNWNDEWETRVWNSGLVAPDGQWSLVALVVTPTNATIHVMNTNGLLSATHACNHVVQAFSGTTLIGDDSGGSGRVFNGTMDEVGIFKRALSKAELYTLYTNAAGAAAYAPQIAVVQPAAQALYAGQTAQFTMVGGGTDPLTYQWQAGPSGGPYAQLADGGRISGSATPTLIINNIAGADALDYLVVLANASGSVTSTVATLTVNSVGAPENITMSVQQATGAYWNTATDWSDGSAASVSAVMKPGSTYELLPGARMRSPVDPTTAIFPGDVLTAEGDGVWRISPNSSAPISEIRFKQPTYGAVNGTVSFKKLVMNGGQLDAGIDGLLILGGEVDILTNTPIYGDNNTDRGIRVDAWLTGSGTIEYHGYDRTSFQSSFVNNLNIAGTSNTYSGTWNVVMGTLLGTQPGAFGTNDITIGVNGALQTTYDIHNTNGSLYLSGRMYLNQNDTFKSVIVGTTALAVGTHTFAELASNFPAYFPTSWTPQTGAATVTNGSGSITVLVTPAPVIVQSPSSLSAYVSATGQFTVLAVAAPPVTYQWRKGGVNLTDGGNLFGASTTNLTITNIAAGNAGSYDVVVTNIYGSATSAVATLTVLANVSELSFNYGGVPIVQPSAGNPNWDTPNQWSDGLPASASAAANPGCVYYVVPGARLRTVNDAVDCTFPGDVLVLEGDGVLGNPATFGEIRFKGAIPSSTVRFKKLVLNGGALNKGDAGNVTITGGEVNVGAKSLVWNDGNSDRGIKIDSWLTGPGDIEYKSLNSGINNAAYVYSLNISGTSNTFSGRWIVDVGTLLGSGNNSSLGTNDITVAAQGALETTYDIYNPYGKLTLDGQIYLHQNDTFRAVTVAGTGLARGTYTFAQLNSLYPANFPATWTQQNGSTVSTGSGSITVTVGETPPEVTLGIQFSGPNLELTWSQGTLLEATNIMGAWTTNLATSPYIVPTTEPQKFFRVQLQ